MEGENTTPKHQQSGALFQCADCKRCYSRPEHLARHIQTPIVVCRHHQFDADTLGKRFACEVCNKAFARADLLKRHAANHTSDPDSRKRKRSSLATGRVSHACRSCASARVKCEESKPCKRCCTRGITCEYEKSQAIVHNAHKPSLGQDDSSIGRIDESPSNPAYSDAGSPVGAAAESLLSMSAVQLATPDTLVHVPSNEIMETYPNEEGLLNMTTLPFSDFLRDVMTLDGFTTPRNEDAHGLAVLNFCDDASLELNDVDFGLLDFWNSDNYFNQFDSGMGMMPASAESTSNMSDMRQKLDKIWKDSPWRWTPDNLDTAFADQTDLSVQAGALNSPQLEERRRKTGRVLQERLEQSSRDKVLAIVLGTCLQPSITSRVASAFPSVEVTDTLLQLFLASHFVQIDSWVHPGTLKLNAQWPEWIGAGLAAGAVLTSDATLRKFGFALQEAVRLAIPRQFEHNNSMTRDLGCVQGFILQLDIGQWSGNKRKMEIAESHSQAPITMLRCARKFQRSGYKQIIVDLEDDGPLLEKKWREWAVQESWRRLTFRMFVRDAQVSMTSMVPPLISYAAMTQALPAPRAIWGAKTAQEWKVLYLNTHYNQERIPSLADVLRDPSSLSQYQSSIDINFSCLIFLHGFWGIVWEYRQLSAIQCSPLYAPPRPTNETLLLSSRHTQLTTALYNFQLLSSDWDATPTSTLLSNLLLMYLHVSFDDLQLFAGKEGEDEARKIFATLQTWAISRDCRQALWHAAQVFRAAKEFPRNHLKDFYAIAVHHASLAIWTYGVVTKASLRAHSHLVSHIITQEYIFLDEQESVETQRFIAAPKGIPAIRGVNWEASMEDPKACMEVALGILRGDGEEAAPIVENLCRMIKQLGLAASGVGLS